MLLCLDFESNVPIYLQIRNQIVIGIADGELQIGERLPTIRALANDLGINMMTVSKAYQLLKTEGYIFGDRRNGAVVKRPNPDKAKISDLSDESQEHLRLIAAEAKLKGFATEDFISLCKEVYTTTKTEDETV